MRARTLRYEIIAMGVVFPIVAWVFLYIPSLVGAVVGVALILVAALLVGLAFRRPPGPAITTVPAPY
ncbi:MAG: hypothetical protein L3K14_08065 [Thermoplasmata archaeon]|nr:hypothetical protein [Thermoplasmata archaeon]